MSRQPAGCRCRVTSVRSLEGRLMALKDVVVHLDPNPRCAVRLGVAARLARRFDAHLTGVQVIDLPSAEFFYGAAMPLVSGGSERVVDEMRAQAVASAEPVQAAFRERLRMDGIEGAWRLVEGNLPATVALHARYSDLTVLGQTNPYEPHDGVGRD